MNGCKLEERVIRLEDHMETMTAETEAKISKLAKEMAERALDGNMNTQTVLENFFVEMRKSDAKFL